MMNLPDARKILIVDDEASLRLFLSEELSDQGYEVHTSANGHEALALLNAQPIDLAIVDLQMPGINGLELMAAIEKMADPPELIMLTAHASLETSIEAMRLGTSDFLLKPYEVDELLRAIERVMKRRRLKLQRRLAAHLLAESFGVTSAPVNYRTDTPEPNPASPTRLEARALIVELETMSVTKSGRPLSLSPTEFRLLTTLMKHPNQPLTFQELADLTHGQTVDAFQARDLLKSHLGRLRRKLGQAPDGQAYIINVHSVGYKFVTN
ncbi:MAG: response regulator transcription factor [Anaerolineales bacterium]|nr:response regulator transcription factor [Anaerolineales bacterium]